MKTHSESWVSCKLRLRRDLQTKIKMTKTAMNLVDIINLYQELSSTNCRRLKAVKSKSNKKVGKD